MVRALILKSIQAQDVNAGWALHMASHAYEFSRVEHDACMQSYFKEGLHADNCPIALL
jgi:hypothetical protein